VSQVVHQAVRDVDEFLDFDLFGHVINVFNVFNVFVFGDAAHFQTSFDDEVRSGPARAERVPLGSPTARVIRPAAGLAQGRYMQFDGLECRDLSHGGLAE
jgi:hypothetical protein